MTVSNDGDLDQYSTAFLGMPLPAEIASRRNELVRTLYGVDQLHEKWLNEHREEEP